MHSARCVCSSTRSQLNANPYQLAADSELSVKNGAELLDRLLKDIVAETASVYIPQYPETEAVRRRADEASGILVPHPDDIANGADISRARKAFSLAHFIPLLWCDTPTGGYRKH